MSYFSNSELNTNFSENLNTVDQHSLSTDSISVCVKSLKDRSIRSIELTTDHEECTEGCLISLPTSESTNQYLMEKTDAISMGMWLATRDYSFRKFVSWAEDCADIIYNRIMELPSGLRDIGYDSSLIAESVLEEAVGSDRNMSNKVWDMFRTGDNQEKFTELVDSHLTDRGLKLDSSSPDRGVLGFLRSAIMFPNKPYRGPGSNNSDFWLPWINTTLTSATRPEELKSGCIAELLLDSCDHAIDAWKNSGDYAGSIESKGVVDVVNVMYLLNLLSPYDSFLLMSTILMLHTNDLGDLERHGIGHWLRSWSESKKYWLEDTPGGFEDPVQLLGLVKASVLTVLLMHPRWGSDTIKDFTPGNWNSVTYNWIHNNY